MQNLFNYNFAISSQEHDQCSGLFIFPLNAELKYEVKVHGLPQSSKLAQLLHQLLLTWRQYLLSLAYKFGHYMSKNKCSMCAVI